MKSKFFQYEYWPFWLFYTAFVPYWILRSIQSKSFSYFCDVNPGIEFGGFLDYSKYKIIQQIPNEFKPKTILISTKKENEIPFEFPFVLKPDFGERGVNVEVIKNNSDWKNYPLHENLILQQFVDLPLEFGIFYAKYPNDKKGKILSITGKEFLVYRANDNLTLKEFVENNPRAVSRLNYLKEKFKDQWEILHPKGTEILLEPIGNHNRGTRFFDASHLISEELTQKISKIAIGINGFHYGRFDVKAASENELKSGKFIILEVNGANSEPTHIYDSKFTLFQAYKEVKRHLDVQFQISKQLPKTHSSKAFFRAIWKRILIRMK